MITFLVIVAAVGLFLALARKRARADMALQHTLEQMPFDELEQLYFETMKKDRRERRNAWLILAGMVALFAFCLVTG